MDAVASISDRVGDLGGYLREQREHAKLSVRQLASLAGVSNPYLSQVERGLRKAIAKVLGLFDRKAKLPADPGAPDEGRPLHILLAEDNPINQKVAKLLLQKMGHSVVVTATGLEALEVSAGENFDLVLMDLQMPQMNGYDAARAIRQREEGSSRHTPIVALTAHAMKGDRELCLEAGMDDYLPKPIHPGALRAALLRWGSRGASGDILEPAGQTHGLPR